MKYTKWSYLYPPRPEYAIPADMLKFYEGRGWWAQYKKNGTCTIIGISPKKEFFCMNRHAENHRTWQLTPYLKEQLALLFPEKKWTVLVAEILHLKTPDIKDTLYIFDALVLGSEMLYDSTFRERQEILAARLKTNVEARTHFICDPKGQIWYAKCFKSGFNKLFNAIKNPKEDEGLVLKNPVGKLRSCLKDKSNTSWQVKCRWGNKNYSF